MTIVHTPFIIGGVMALVAVALFTDLRYRLIPNALTFPAIALGLLVNFLSDGWLGAAMAAAGMLVGGLIFFLPFAFGKMGGGDVKLMAAVGAWVGPLAVISVALYTAIAGGVMALYIAIGHDRLRETLKNTWLLTKCTVLLRSPAGSGMLFERSVGMPYGVAIAAGVFCYLAIGSVI